MVIQDKNALKSPTNITAENHIGDYSTIESIKKAGVQHKILCLCPASYSTKANASVFDNTLFVQ
jgi:hypothetical protein